MRVCDDERLPRERPASRRWPLLYEGHGTHHRKEIRFPQPIRTLKLLNESAPCLSRTASERFSPPVTSAAISASALRAPAVVISPFRY